MATEVNEKKIINDMNSMCVESLNPESFKKWEQVKLELESNRVALK